jgi:hypothetical protein
MATTPALAVIDDYGPVGKGASQARYVLAENGSEYIVKGPSLTPAHPTVAANEWIAAQIAMTLGLPVLDCQIVEMNGDLFFGSSYMQKGSWYPAISTDLFKQCENRERAYDLVVFDTWLINPDRHRENLVVRRVAQPEDRLLLLLNDHSHLLVSPAGPISIGGLMACLDQPPGGFVRLACIKASIVNADRLSKSLDLVEAMDDADLQAIVASTPSELLSSEGQSTYADFLVQRRSKLRDLFKSDLAAFPQLKGTL